jgi:hypothetical protein
VLLLPFLIFNNNISKNIYLPYSPSFSASLLNSLRSLSQKIVGQQSQGATLGIKPGG